MKVTYIGHACFKVESKGYSVIIDPYEDGYVPGYDDLREEANMVLCTHDHGDHNAEQNVDILPGGECPFEITEIETYHDDQQGEQRGMTRMYILDDGEKRLAHLGDIGCELTDEQMREFYQVDVLLLPVGGYYTIGPREAAQITVDLDPKVTIPMHYRNEERRFGLAEIGTVYDYLALMSGVMLLSRSEYDTDEDNPGRIIVLQPANSTPMDEQNN